VTGRGGFGPRATRAMAVGVAQNPFLCKTQVVVHILI
jgi:hypothetical protein